MARKANAPVGVCQCPVVNCTAERAPLFRFATRAKDAKDARKAGKYYGRCPTHGWFGYDGAPGMQAYIRQHGKLSEGEKWDSDEKPGASESVKPAAQPANAGAAKGVEHSRSNALPVHARKDATETQAAAVSAPAKAPAVVPNRPKAAAVVTPAAPKTKAPARDVWDL